MLALHLTSLLNFILYKISHFLQENAHAYTWSKSPSEPQVWSVSLTALETEFSFTDIFYLIYFFNKNPLTLSQGYFLSYVYLLFVIFFFSKESGKKML